MQIVTLSDDFEDAICYALCYILNSKEKKPLSEFGLVKKVPNFLQEKDFSEESRKFYIPLMLADAGFHYESIKLKNFFENEK